MTAHSDTPESAIIAAMRLSEEASYSWTTAVVDDAQSYTIEGKTEGGYTWQRQPMPKSIARRLGRSADRDIEGLFTGPADYLIHTDEGWKTFDELPKQHDDWRDDEYLYYVPALPVRSSDMPADAAEWDPFGPSSVVYVPVLIEQEKSDQVYSNAQFALALPHEELGIVVSSHADFQLEGNVAHGTLTDLGTRLLLVHDGHEYIRPVVGAGRFKLWIAEGRVTKYKLELAGILLVDGDTVRVRQTSTTTVQDIGTTRVSIPDYARRKLRGG